MGLSPLITVEGFRPQMCREGVAFCNMIVFREGLEVGLMSPTIFREGVRV